MKTALQRLQHPYKPVEDSLIKQVESEVYSTSVDYDIDSHGVRFLDYSWSRNKEGQMHGYARGHHSQGVLREEQFYINGKEHGLSTQYYPDGSLLVAYIMDMGTGIDLWCLPDGSFSEETHKVDGCLHGPRRWRAANQRLIAEEYHHKTYHRHGIFRDWTYTCNENEDDDSFELKDVQVLFFLHDQQVTREEYQSRAIRDPQLPPFRLKDNAPHRPLPILASNWPLSHHNPNEK